MLLITLLLRLRSGVGTAGDKGYMYPAEKSTQGTSSLIVPRRTFPDCSKNGPDSMVFAQNF